MTRAFGGTTGSAHRNRPASRQSFHAGGTTRAPVLALLRSEQQVASRRSCSYCSVRSGLAIERVGGSVQRRFFLVTRQAAFDTPWMDLWFRSALGSNAPVPMLAPTGSFWRVWTDEGQHLVGQLVRVAWGRVCGGPTQQVRPLRRRPALDRRRAARSRRQSRHQSPNGPRSARGEAFRT